MNEQAVDAKGLYLFLRLPTIDRIYDIIDRDRTL